MTYEEKKAEILAAIAKEKADGVRGILRRVTDGYRPSFAEAAEDRARKIKAPRNVRTEKCKYAQDTGEIAFPAAPCRGNRIICQHPQNTGFASFTKQCQRGKCVFFDAQT